MKFHCEYCGRGLRVADGQAGGKCKCPKCRQIVTIPAAVVQAERAGDGPVTAGSPTYDPLLLNVPPADAASGPAAEPETTEEAYNRLRALYGGRLMEREEAPERTLPWLIDIFLYPMSKSGLLILALSAGVPLILRAALRFFFYFMGKVQVMLIFWVLAIIVHWAGFAMFFFYMVWYVWECIRDSAGGGIRAANTTSSTPGLGELLGRTFAVIGTAAVCMAPAAVYMRHGRDDPLFWTLYAIGGFVFPMALLAVVMFESFRGLNPMLLLGSILSTPVRYTAVVVFCYPLCMSLPLAIYCAYASWTVGYFFLFLAYYQLLIFAHLLGRFYWKSEDRLNWDT